MGDQPAQEEEEIEDDQPVPPGFDLGLVQFLLHSRLVGGGNSDTNAKMVSVLKKRKLITPDTERAFLAVPRGDFFPTEHAEEAYQDTPVRYAAMVFNISAPHMYATCLQHLHVEEGNTFLDIGSGCGHMTCLAGYMVGPRGHAHGLEIRADIIEFAKNNTKKFEEKSGISMANVTFDLRNCFLPDYHGRTYDRIHVGACCPTSFLPALHNLLNPGGILVTPYADHLIKVAKDENGAITTTTLMDVRYGDLIIPSEHEAKQAEIQVTRFKATHIEVEEDTLVSDFSSMLDNSKLSDVIFNLGGKLIYAHKFMLAFRCPYLHTLVQSVITSNNNNNKNTKRSFECVEVSIGNVPYEVLKSILKFVYSGEMRIDPLHAPNILQAAVEFNLPFIVEQCQKYIQSGNPSPTVITDNLRGELANLVNSDRLADVVFLVEGAKVFGHRFILSVRSEYFRSTFTTGMKEAAQQEIPISEVGKAEFVAVLRFIYTGDMAVVTEENVVDILEAANYFSETRLKSVCEDVLKRGIEVENVAYVLDVANRFAANQLFNYCSEYIFKNFEVVKKTATFNDLDRELIVNLLSEACKRIFEVPDDE